MRTYQEYFGKLPILIGFKEYVDNMFRCIHSANGNFLRNSALFLYGRELVRRVNFSDTNWYCKHWRIEGGGLGGLGPPPLKLVKV